MLIVLQYFKRFIKNQFLNNKQTALLSSAQDQITSLAFLGMENI